MQTQFYGTWAEMPTDVLSAIHDRVNEQLVKEEIPEVKYDVFAWRRARALGAQRGSKSSQISTLRLI